jgi:hypothetical protein
VHVLLTDDRAEHVPGCNMAFWRDVLVDVGGFDPVYTAAGDDVDVCWKVLDAGWEIGFHPAALVWHHRRAGLRPYLRQQLGYGRAESLVAARHPERFTSTGSARWRGRIYTSVEPSLRNGPVYRGLFGTAPFQSVYQGGGTLNDLAHQIGVPIALLLAITSLLTAAIAPQLLLVTIFTLLFIAALGVRDALGVRAPRGTTSPWAFRTKVAALHLLQPLARWWGRRRHSAEAKRTVPAEVVPPVPSKDASRNVLVFENDRARGELAALLAARLRRSGRVVSAVTGWEDHDGEVRGSFFVRGQLLTSAHLPGCVIVRVRRRLRTAALVPFALATTLTVMGATAAGLTTTAIAVTDVAWGCWRVGPSARRVLGGGAQCSRTSR